MTKTELNEVFGELSIVVKFLKSEVKEIAEFMNVGRVEHLIRDSVLYTVREHRGAARTRIKALESENSRLENLLAIFEEQNRVLEEELTNKIYSDE